MTHSQIQKLSFGVLGKGSNTSRLESQGGAEEQYPWGGEGVGKSFLPQPQFSHLSHGGTGLGLTFWP